MPESTGKLLDLLGQPDDKRTFAVIHPIGAGHAVARPGRCLPALSGGVKPVARSTNRRRFRCIEQHRSDRDEVISIEASHVGRKV